MMIKFGQQACLAKKGRRRILKYSLLALLFLYVFIAFGHAASALEIGGRPAGYFNGTIDEVRIYNRSVSAGEVWMHYSMEFKKYNASSWGFYINATNLQSGTYSYYTYANDTAGNFAQSEMRVLYGGSPPSPPAPPGSPGGTYSGGSAPPAAGNKSAGTGSNVTAAIITENKTNITAVSGSEIMQKAKEKIEEIKARLRAGDTGAKQKIGSAEAAYKLGDYAGAYAMALEAEGLIGKAADAAASHRLEEKKHIYPYYAIALVAAVLLASRIYAWDKKRRVNGIYRPQYEIGGMESEEMKARAHARSLPERSMSDREFKKNLDEIDRLLKEINRKK